MNSGWRVQVLIEIFNNKGDIRTSKHKVL
uniref:Uncharacterized protein n=1 Tax=Arundo donax TaxID=35708 RepID=A0A0A8Z7B0_ARUDO